MPTFEQIQAEIAGMLDLSDEELTPEQRAALDVYLAELGTDEKNKVDAFARFVKESEARAEFFKEEGKRLSAKAKSVENSLGRLKDHYAVIMRRHNLKKIHGDVYDLSLRASASVGVTALTDELPDEYVRVKVEREPNKKAIGAALKSGVAIPGCTLVEIERLQIS